jgi:alpha-galactosidase
VLSAARGIAWIWQIEDNGAWRFAFGALQRDGYLVLAGPCGSDHQ